MTTVALAGAVGLAAAVLTRPSAARATPTSTPLTTQAPTVPNEPNNLIGPPETVLYALFFSQADGLIKQAARLKRSGAHPALLSFLQDYYVQQAGLTQAENDEVFQAASSYTAANAPVESEAKGIISRFRAAYRAYSISQGPAPGDPRPRLRQLDLERDGNLMAARQQLESELGPNGFYQLEVYVHETFDNAARARLGPTGIAGSPGGAQ